MESIGRPPLPPSRLARARLCPAHSWIRWSLLDHSLQENFSHRCQWLPEVRYSSFPMLQPRPPAFQKMYLEDKSWSGLIFTIMIMIMIITIMIMIMIILIIANLSLVACLKTGRPGAHSTKSEEERLKHRIVTLMAMKMRR